LSEIRKLISRWHRDEPGAERKAARRRCPKALAPILDIIRKNAVHASLKRRWTLHGNAPHDTAPSLSQPGKLRALCWVLRRRRAACDTSGRAAEKFSKVRATYLEELILKARYADVDFIDDVVALSIISDLLALGAKPMLQRR
jgi:hypothetical protein